VGCILYQQNQHKEICQQNHGQINIGQQKGSKQEMILHHQFIQLVDWFSGKHLWFFSAKGSPVEFPLW
jgi:hypothetical protein